VLTASIIKTVTLMMEAVCTSEASVNFYETTQHNIPEGSHLRTRRRENLKNSQELFALKPNSTAVSCFSVCDISSKKKDFLSYDDKLVFSFQQMERCP
jgi:hypothetical protein